jgi:RNA polymerase sigma-70 factor (ECF subfamily)
MIKKTLCFQLFCKLEINKMDDKTPQQLLIEYIDFIRRTIFKIKISKNIKLDEDDINDIYQNVCVKLLDKGFANYSGKSKLETYLFKIIYNEVISYIEKKQKLFIESYEKLNLLDSSKNSQKIEECHSNFIDYLSPVYEDTSNSIVFDDINAIIDDTVDTFDDKDKLIFKWYFLDKKSQTQIAKMVKLSQPTVYERIEKIKKQIIMAIKKKYPELEEELLS